MTQRYTVVTETVKPEWREKRPGIDLNKGSILAAENAAATAFGLVKAGTIMSYMTDGSGQIRPYPFQQLDSAVAAAAACDVDDAACFFVGDILDGISMENAYDVLTIIAAATAETFIVTANNPGNTTMLVSLVDPSGNSQPLVITVTNNGVNTLVAVSLATDGAGAITSTIAEVMALINTGVILTATLGTAVGTETCIAVAAGTMVGGALPGEVLDASVVVLSVDKTSTPNVVTLTAVATLPATAGLVLHDAGFPIAGMIETQEQTIELQAGAVVNVDRSCALGISGYFRPADVAGYDALLAPYLTGAHVGAEGALGAGQMIGMAGMYQALFV